MKIRQRNDCKNIINEAENGRAQSKDTSCLLTILLKLMNNLFNRCGFYFESIPYSQCMQYRVRFSLKNLVKILLTLIGCKLVIIKAGAARDDGLGEDMSQRLGCLLNTLKYEGSLSQESTAELAAIEHVLTDLSATQIDIKMRNAFLDMIEEIRRNEKCSQATDF